MCFDFGSPLVLFVPFVFRFTIFEVKIIQAVHNSKTYKFNL